MKEIGIYIHIPFCQRKCYYCDFCSYEGKLSLQNKYVEAVKKELLFKSKEDNYSVNTIFIGGGTPSVIEKEQIAEIINEIKKDFSVSNNAEITIEINPGTVDKEKLELYKIVGINRLSIGLQSTENRLLNEIGRIHTYEQFEETYFSARSSGFKNINVDLIIGLPNQTVDDVKKSIKKVIDLKPEHISMYSLIVEENTKIYDLISKGELTLPLEDEERNMYWEAKKQLESDGYKHYEISNFARDNYFSKHNSDCWKQKEYIGVGAAAHSYIDGKRFSNTTSIEDYIENCLNEKIGHNIKVHEVQSIEDMMNEYMIVGLRLIDGVDIKEFEDKFNVSPLKYYEEALKKLKIENLISIDDKKIRLSHRGLDLANLVWEQFI